MKFGFRKDLSIVGVKGLLQHLIGLSNLLILVPYLGKPVVDFTQKEERGHALSLLLTDCARALTLQSVIAVLEPDFDADHAGK